jgi:hypothetical protein
MPNTSDLDTLSPSLLALLQRGMAQYRNDPAGAEFLFGFARSQAPDSLPLYRVLIKFYNRQRRFDAAYDLAVQGMATAARQCSLPSDWRDWTPELLAGKDTSFVLLTLKAMAFLELRRDNASASVELLEKLKLLDPEDGVGGSVVTALAEGV